MEGTIFKIIIMHKFNSFKNSPRNMESESGKLSIYKSEAQKWKRENITYQ